MALPPGEGLEKNARWHFSSLRSDRKVCEQNVHAGIVRVSAEEVCHQRSEEERRGLQSGAPCRFRFQLVNVL